MLSTKAVSVEIALPDAPEPGKALALLLPRTPPIRSAAALVVPAGTIDAADHRVILLIEGDNLHIQELRLTGPTEKTGSFEVFNVSPDDSSLPRSNHRTE